MAAKLGDLSIRIKQEALMNVHDPRETTVPRLAHHITYQLNIVEQSPTLLPK